MELRSNTYALKKIINNIQTKLIKIYLKRIKKNMPKAVLFSLYITNISLFPFLTKEFNSIRFIKNINFLKYKKLLKRKKNKIPFKYKVPHFAFIFRTKTLKQPLLPSYLSRQADITNNSIRGVNNSKGRVFFSALVSKFVKNGKKRKALSILMRSFYNLNLVLKNNRKPRLSLILHYLLKKLNPRFFFKKKAKGRRVLLIPHLLFKKKKIPTSARWIKAVLRTKLKKKALPAHKLISAELLQTFLGKGDILKHKNSQTQLAIDSKINCKPTFRKPNFIKKY